VPQLASALELGMLNSDSERNIETMAKLYIDPKEWPKQKSPGAAK
jgi:hypothetical protein